MNRNSIIGILLIFGLMIGYTMYMSPSKEELAARKRAQDSIAALQKIAQPVAVATDSFAAFKADSGTVVKPQQPQPVNKSEAGPFAVSSTGNNRNFVIASDKVKLTISSLGGRISQAELPEYKTFDGKPLILFGPDSSQFNLAFFSDVRAINTGNLYFVPFWTDKRFEGRDSIQAAEGDSVQFAMRLYAGPSDSIINENAYIEYLYTIKSGDYRVGFSVHFVGLNGIIAPATKEINIDWAQRIPRLEKSIENEKLNTTIYYQHADREVDYLSERKDDNQSISTRLKWVSFKQQFFSTTLIADDYFQNAELKKKSTDTKNTEFLESMNATLSLAYNPNSDDQMNLTFFFGPNKYNILRKYKLDLERQIPLGWSFFLMQWINRFAVIPVFNYLEGFNLNYGIIILILTILLKIFLLPIAYKTYLSSAKMRLLKPEIDELNAKFPKKEDAMKKQQATMNLYKKAGVNPMAGCVPMLLQFPILLAMFRFFPASIELRQQAFLWAKDLSSYDSIYNLPFNIPFYGDHVSLFTLLMTISTIIYTKINNDMMSTGNQMPGMKTMMYMMPIMFLGFFNSYSSGLSYYYLLANLMTFAQMYLIRRFVNEDKLHAQIQENKKKPVKKSNFQKRLEDMAKQQGKK